MLDWIFFALYFALNLEIGFYCKARAGKSVDEFFLGGRNVLRWLAGARMMATTFAADTPLALTGLAYKDGIAGAWKLPIVKERCCYIGIGGASMPGARLVQGRCGWL